MATRVHRLLLCRMCLVTNVKMVKISTSESTMREFEDFCGEKFNIFGDGLTLLCSECFTTLKKFTALRKKCIRALTALNEMRVMVDTSMLDDLRYSLNLASNVSIKDKVFTLQIYKGTTYQDNLKSKLKNDIVPMQNMQKEIKNEQTGHSNDEIAEFDPLISNVRTMIEYIECKPDVPDSVNIKEELLEEAYIENEEANYYENESHAIESNEIHGIGIKEEPSDEEDEELLVQRIENTQEEDMYKSFEEIEDFQHTRTVFLTTEQQLSEAATRKTSSDYTDAPFRCSDCIIPFSNQRLYDNHRLNHKQNNGNFECLGCHMYYKTMDDLKNHEISHILRYICVKCGYTSKSREQAYHHEETHQKPTVAPFHCATCAIKFRSKIKYNHHMKTNHDIYQYPCNLCRKVFYRKKTMTLHKRICQVSLQLQLKKKCKQPKAKRK